VLFVPLKGRGTIRVVDVGIYMVVEGGLMRVRIGLVRRIIKAASIASFALCIVFVGCWLGVAWGRSPYLRWKPK